MRELLASTSARELAEWQAYYRLEPWGERRADERAGLIAATVYNMARGRDAPALGPVDFIPIPCPVEREAHRSASLSQRIKASFGAAFGRKG